MAKAVSEEKLMDIARKALPKGMPKEAIVSVEVDCYGNSERSDGVSYWVYLRSGFRAEGGRGCHTIHEDTIKEIKDALWGVVETDDDDDGYAKRFVRTA